MRIAARVLTLVVVATLAAPLAAEEPKFTPKVTHVTAFKDGHALVLARGKAVLQDGWCRTTDVPTPVLGAFWGFVADEKLRVDRITADLVETPETRPCLSLAEMIEANAGKDVVITERLSSDKDGLVQHSGRLLGVLKHETKREEMTSVPGPERFDRYGNSRGQPSVPVTREVPTEVTASFVMVQTADGVRLVQQANIVNMSVIGKDPVTTTEKKEKKRTVSLHVAAEKGAAPNEVEAGLVYIERGVRWIPDYRVELLDNGQARISLQATVVNDLADLEDVELGLVVGVPSFIMAGELSPMALRENGRWLSSYFLPPGRGDSGNLGHFMNNAVMSQRAASFDYDRPTAAAGGPDVPSEGQMEDLYVYRQPHFTLKKGGRAVIQLAEVTVAYEDIYTWDIPALPPPEMWDNINRDELRQAVAALAGAKAMHKVRLTNSSNIPWTTGPATIIKKGAVLGQQLMTYTSLKNTVDLPVTIATDLNTKKEEIETGREPNALTINNNRFTKITLHGTVTVKNFKDKPAKLSVRRLALGKVTAATADGKIVQVNAIEADDLMGDGVRPIWWSWPWWWFRANSVSRVSWDVSVPAGESVTLEYDWYYYGL